MGCVPSASKSAGDRQNRHGDRRNQTPPQHHHGQRPGERVSPQHREPRHDEASAPRYRGQRRGEQSPQQYGEPRRGEPSPQQYGEPRRGEPSPQQYGEPRRGEPSPQQYGEPRRGEPSPNQYGEHRRGDPSPHQHGEPRPHRGNEPNPANHEMDDVFLSGDGSDENVSKGTPFESIVNICRQPPFVKDMTDCMKDKKNTFMIKPWKYNSSDPNQEPEPNYENGYYDQWDDYHVRMPCSPSYLAKNKQPMWDMIHLSLSQLKQKCDSNMAEFEDLKATIEKCTDRQYEMGCLETLINQVYTKTECDSFMSTTLSNICQLALTVDLICGQPPALLRIGMDLSVTMSQQQAASLLACSFFCLFPFRSDQPLKKEYVNYPSPNFNKLYKSGPPQKIEKLKCILHYFRRLTKKMPTGVITFRRFPLSSNAYPRWDASTKELCDMHLTTGKKIEDVDCTLQVDFANKYIGGGVLGSGCVQEEIRFTICPEMLVSLLICEVMEPNECINLIGCERYSSYKGYAGSFQFESDHVDKTPKDSWGRKWCHLVAMDAIFFRQPSTQYDMGKVERELLKAFVSFHPRGDAPDRRFGIVTGNWGCGAFNGDKQLKGIIQLMAASQVQRPLIYAAYGDKNLINSFSNVYDYLKEQKATVRDLYLYLHQYSTQYQRSSLFNYILEIPVVSLKS